MSFSETIFLFVLALIVFGPKKLPEIARYIGKALNEFRRASNEFKAQIEQEINNLEVEKHRTILPPNPTPAGATSRSQLIDAPATLAAPAATPSEPPPLATEAVAPAAEAATPEAAAPVESDIPVNPVASDEKAPTSQESHV